MFGILLSLALAGEPAAVSPSLEAYDRVRVALTNDDLSGAKAGVSALNATVSGDPAALAASSALASAPDLTAARAAFGDLSKALLVEYAVAAPEELHVYFCPMTSTFPYWLQPTAGLKNPYMGTKMPDCGEGVGLKAALKAVQ